MVKDLDKGFIMKILKQLIFGLIPLIANLAYSAPIDYNNDSFSDPSAVTVESKLKWLSIIDNQNETVIDSFGKAGQHLVPGKYNSRKTQPATVDSSGVWRISDESSINFGDSDSVFIAGADFDGDDRTDLAYSSNACLNVKSNFSILTNPLGENPIYREFSSIRGSYFKTYLDSNNDNIDELCSLIPVRIARQFTNKFKIRCTNIITSSKSVSFNLGQVFNAPIRVKVKNQADLLMIYTQTASKTRIRLLNTRGQTISKAVIEANGTIVVGNFTSQDSEQIAVVKDGVGKVFDILTQTTTDLAFPDGIPYDQVNIINFQDNQDCFCTSRTINQNGNCKGSTKNPQVPPVEEVKEYYIPDNCSNPPEYITPNDGFKCIASATRNGSIVCILPYQFTWEPRRNITDHHGYTFGCNKNDEHFDKVELVLKTGERIPLAFAYCANYVATADGPIGRQHFRNENYQWNSVANRVVTLEMVKGNKKTCLKF